MKQHNKRFLSVLLALALVIALFPVLSASAGDYGLFIKGRRVTDSNRTDVWGDGIFEHSPANNILYIKGDATADSSVVWMIESWINNLWICPTVDCTLDCANNGIRITNDASIRGDKRSPPGVLPQPAGHERPRRDALRLLRDLHERADRDLPVPFHESVNPCNSAFIGAAFAAPKKFSRAVGFIAIFPLLVYNGTTARTKKQHLERDTMKRFLSRVLAILLAAMMLVGILPASAFAGTQAADLKSVAAGDITIDEDPADGYEGDYVVIYNPSISAADVCSAGTMTGLIKTEIDANVTPGEPDPNALYRLDVDAQMAERARRLTGVSSPEDLPARKAGSSSDFKVGDTNVFQIYGPYSPTGSGEVQFKCLYVGEHCYIWTPTSEAANVYALDKLGDDLAAQIAAEFDTKFDLMQSSFGDHLDMGTDGRLHMLYYNIDEGWEPGRGYMAGFFYAADLYYNGLPMLNIDTYPGVIYPDYFGEGEDWVRVDSTFNTMVHEYQHLINFSNTYGMPSWLNESFSAAAEEICYPGSSVVPRIQSWENYFCSSDKDWLDPPAEFEYQPDFNLHNGYSLYDWNNGLNDILALYSQVSFFAQYLFTRFGNTIYQQISAQFDGDCISAISAAAGEDCSQLVKEFRVAVTANAAQDQYGGIYGFKAQEGFDPEQYHNVQNPWELLSPIVFTGTSCDIKGGGAITVKPVDGVYVPPADASPELIYIGIKVPQRAKYTVVYSACGTEKSLTVRENNSVKLPSSVVTEVEGWRFAGWTREPVAQTAEKPSYYEPGTLYAVTEDVTFYALFTHDADSDALYSTEPLILHTPVLVPAAEPNCTEVGNAAYYRCDVCGKCFSDESCETEITQESAVIPAAGHTPGEAAPENEIAATCTEAGSYDAVVRCTVCGEILSSEHVETEALGHTPGEPVSENVVAPTCTEAGSYDAVLYCTVCGEELSRERAEIEALGHDWNEPEYVWADDFGTVAATRTCKTDADHVETETVSTTSAVTKEATYEEEGEIVYTATFENAAFAVQTKAVATPKLVKLDNPFADVAETDYFYDAVLWAYYHEPQVTNGLDATHFGPYATCTRGQIVTFLWRALGEPAPTITENPFVDVKESDYYYKAVLWAYENGVTTGTDATHFAPGAFCKREHAVAFLYRAAGKPEYTNKTNPFSDVSSDAYYYDAVLWAVEKNITKASAARSSRSSIAS